MKPRKRFLPRPLKRPMTRGSEVARARRQLQHHGWPRLQMALIVLLTGGAGFLASYLLRLAGLDSMLLRYPLAVLLAYGVFLLLMWIWIRWRWDAVVDGVADVASSGGGGSPPRSGPAWGGSGGHSGGGGASASWAEAPAASVMDSDAPALLEVADSEAGLPLLVVLGIVAIAASVLLASAWVVWSAPVLMAELLVDAAIVGGLYRRMQGMGAQGWWRLCLSHTIWPLLGLLVFFAALGWLAQELAPGAVNLMQVVRAL